MLCYRDRAFCASDCVNKKCDRYFGEKVRNRAIEAQLPVSKMNFSEKCSEYKSPKDKK